jgi:hypothetical protein
VEEGFEVAEHIVALTLVDPPCETESMQSRGVVRPQAVEHGRYSAFERQRIAVGTIPSASG